MMPPLLFSSSSSLLTMTLSCRGRTFNAIKPPRIKRSLLNHYRRIASANLILLLQTSRGDLKLTASLLLRRLIGRCSKASDVGDDVTDLVFFKLPAPAWHHRRFLYRSTPL